MTQNHYSSLEEYLGTLARVGGGFCEKVDDFVERDIVVACIFVDIFEVREFLGSSVINDLRSTYQVDVL